MSSAVEQIIVEVAMDSRDFNRNLRRTQVSVRQFGTQLQNTTARGSKGMGNFLTTSKVALVALAFALKKVASSVFEAGDAFDLLHQKLIASSGSSENARKAFAESKRIANGLGLDVKSVAEGFAKFQQAGGKAFGKDTVKIFEQLSTGVAGLGANSEETKGIFLAFSQILAKGKLSIEEVNQLAERGIGRNLIAEALGVDSIEGVDIKAPKAIEKIASFMENRFKKASEKGANSINGMKNRMANNMLELQVEFNNVIKPFRSLFLSLGSTVLNVVRGFMPQIKAFVNILKTGVAFWLRNILPVSLAWSKAIWSLMGAIMDLVSIALKPLVDAMKDLFNLEGADTFTETIVRGLFKATAVFQNFVDSVKLGYLSIKEAGMKALGIEIPDELAKQIDTLDKKMAKAFEKSDKEASKLIKTLKGASDALLNFKEADVKGDDGKKDTPKIESSATGGKGAGAIEFASTEAFKIIGTKVDRTDKANLDANKRTARAVEKIERKTDNDKVLDV